MLRNEIHPNNYYPDWRNLVGIDITPKAVMCSH